MVTFTETGFTIVVETGINPIEAWLETHDEMIDCLQSEDEHKQAYRYHFLELMRNMMPNYETALKLTNPKVHETIAKVVAAAEAKASPKSPPQGGDLKKLRIL